MHEKRSEAYEWILRSEVRKTIVCTMTQPLTAIQLAGKTGMKAHTCMSALRELGHRDFLTCLNPKARQNRLYWLKPRGKQVQRALWDYEGRPPKEHDFPSVDWTLYGWLCFRHRAAIVRNLGEPMQPALIRRKARSREPGLRMSGNNVRDAIREMYQTGIVQRVSVRKKAHARYVLAPVLEPCQRLLRQAVWMGAG